MDHPNQERVLIRRAHQIHHVPGVQKKRHPPPMRQRPFGHVARRAVTAMSSLTAVHHDEKMECGPRATIGLSPDNQAGLIHPELPQQRLPPSQPSSHPLDASVSIGESVARLRPIRVSPESALAPPQ